MEGVKNMAKLVFGLQQSLDGYVDHRLRGGVRSLPKWVVSHSLKAVDPNATLVQNDVGTVLRELKARLVGEIDVAGPDLARSLTDLGLVDEYRLHFRPFVLGHGTPFFAGPGRRSASWPAISLARA
jgi:riboflavin biosynthesis pyrimidine reductase